MRSATSSSSFNPFPLLNSSPSARRNAVFFNRRVRPQKLRRKLVCEPPAAGNFIADDCRSSQTKVSAKEIHDSIYWNIRSVVSSGSRSIRYMPTLCFNYRRSDGYKVSSAERSPVLNYSDDYNADPFWLSRLIKECIWNARSLFQFLIEQPGQLKYIEWPTFDTTLRTAMLTLVLVASLVVALSSVDSALSYLLASFLRSKA